MSFFYENIRFFCTVRPKLIAFSLSAVSLYAIGKFLEFLSNVPLPGKTEDMLDFVWSKFSLIIEFIFCGPILIMLGLILIAGIINSFNKRKVNKRLPIIGIPDKNNVTVLLMLFKLRCLEIGQLYYVVRNFQKDAGEGNWVELFLIDFFENYNSDDSWFYLGNEKKIEKQKQRNKEIVSELMKNKFNFDSEWWYSNKQPALADLVIALKQENRIYDRHRLQEIYTFGTLQNTISALLKRYDKFYSESTILFISDKRFAPSKSSIFVAQEEIEDIWEKIISALKSSLIFLKMQNNTFFNIEQILKEIDALRSMQKNIAIKALLMQKNRFEEKSIKYEFFAPKKESENLILNKIKENPLLDLG